MNILFDADSMIYASCYDTEVKDFYSDVDQAIEKYEDQLDVLRHEIEDFTWIDTFNTFHGSRGNFRNYIGDRSYKANRKGDRPEMIDYLNEYVRLEHDGISGYGVETDDVVAKYWYNNLGVKERTRDDLLIVAIDKDYKQLPCWLYNYHYKHKTLLDISYDDARHNFYEQMVCGDASDNVNYLHGKGKAFCRKYFVRGDSEYQYRRKTFQLFQDRYKGKAREKYIECYHLLRLKMD